MAGRGGIGRQIGALACVGMILLTPGLALPQSVDEDCEPEKSRLQDLMSIVDAVIDYVWGSDSESPAPPVPPAPAPVLPPLPEPRYAPIAMSTCAERLASLDLDAVANATRDAGCRDQHPCTMRRYYDHTAIERDIDPTFYMAVKFRESRWMHWNADGSVRVSSTDDWGSAQINRPNFRTHYAREYDWEQVVEDPLYNTRLGAALLSPPDGGFGCLDFAERRLEDHFALHEFFTMFQNRMPEDIRAETMRLADLPWETFRREMATVSPELQPYQYIFRNLSSGGHIDLKKLINGTPAYWQYQISLAPFAPHPYSHQPSRRQILEAAYACYNGGVHHWRRPWYARTAFARNVEEFRNDLDLMQNLDALIWDDDYIDGLRTENAERTTTRRQRNRNTDVEHLLRSLRACTERPDLRQDVAVSSIH